MFVNRKLPVCLVAATLMAGGVAAQDSPSWRALQETPSRPEVPPDIERPEYEFSVSRDELMGFVPRADDSANAEPKSQEAEPQRIESDLDYGAAELVPVANVDEGPAGEPPQSIEDETGPAPGIVPEEVAGANFEQPEPFEFSFDTDPAPIPTDASAVAIEAEPVALDAAADHGPRPRDEARFAVSEMARDESHPIEALAGDEDLMPALEDQAGLAFVDAAAAPPPELESIDQRAPIAAAFVDSATEPAAADSEVAEALAPAAVTNPPFADEVSAGPAVDYRLVRRRTAEPQYPRKAHRARLEGWVNLRVTVAPNGAVVGVEVTDAEPHRVFEESAIRAVRKWRFEPPRLAGVSTPQSGLYRISYTLEDR